MIIEDAMFTLEGADQFGRLISRHLARVGLWPAGVRMKTLPLPPVESRSRIFSDATMKPMPWMIEQEPRLEIGLRVLRHDIWGDEFPRDELLPRLHKAKTEIATLLGQPVPFNDTYVEATVDQEEDLRERESTFDLHFGLTLLEV